MKLISKIKNNKWIRIIGNKYLIITVFFVFWMLFFDTNSFLIHKELNDDIKKLEENKKAYLEEIINDKIFIDKMKDRYNKFWPLRIVLYVIYQNFWIKL